MRTSIFCIYLVILLVSLSQSSNAGGIPSRNERPSNVGEKETDELNEGNPRGESLLSPAQQPLSNSLADEVDANFGGNRAPGNPGIIAHVPRLKPTGITNEYRVEEDPSGQFKAGDIVTCDTDGKCSKH